MTARSRRAAGAEVPDALRLELLRALQAKAELAAEVTRLRRELTLARTTKAPRPLEPCMFCGATGFANRGARNKHIDSCPQRSAGSPDVIAAELLERATKAERAYDQALRTIERLQEERDDARAKYARLRSRGGRPADEETRHGA